MKRTAALTKGEDGRGDAELRKLHAKFDPAATPLLPGFAGGLPGGQRRSTSRLRADGRPRRQRLRGQIDYRDRRAVAEARQRQLDRRQQGGRYVVGMFELVAGNVSLVAVRAHAGSYMPDLGEGLTPFVDRFYRWRTRQAAHQWLNARPELEAAAVIDLSKLVGLPVPAAFGSAWTAGQESTAKGGRR